MRYDKAFFDAGIDRRGTGCEKWDDQNVCGEDALPLWVADWDFACADPIVKAIQKRAEHACYGYSCYSPSDAKAFCGFWQRRHHLTILPAQTAMLPCVVTGLKLCVRAFTKPGDGVIVQTPVYGPFFSSVKCNGRRILEARLLEGSDRRWHMNLAAIEDHLRSGARMMLLCNPHNPVSRLWSKEELEALVSLLARYGAFLISDEIHADFVYAPLSFAPILSVKGAAERTVMLASASKTFNIPGLQQATAVSFNENLLHSIKIEQEASGAVCGNTMALAATQAAYSACDDWLDGMLSYLTLGREILKDALAEKLPKARLTPLETTCLAWIDVRAYGLSADQAVERAKNKGVILTAGTHFGQETGEGFIRLNIASPHAQLLEGVSRFASAMNE